MICFRLHNCFRKGNRFGASGNCRSRYHIERNRLRPEWHPKSQVSCLIMQLETDDRMLSIAGNLLACRFFLTLRASKVFLSLFGPLRHLPLAVRHRLRLHGKSGGCVSHNSVLSLGCASELLTPYHPVSSLAGPLLASLDSHPASPCVLLVSC